MLTPALQAAGARHSSARAPDPITLEWLQQQCEQMERVYRLQFEGGLDPQIEHELAQLKPASDTTRALRLWALLKHLYRVRSDNLVKVAAQQDEVEEAARQMLMREPVRVEVAPGVVADVTGRSYAALLRMAEHDLRIRLLRTDLEAAAESFGLWQARAEAGVRGERSFARRQMRRLQAVHRAIALEMHAHRQMLYAHALTPDGAPARGPEDAPEWWEQIDERADARLLAALFEVTIGRYRKLGDPPKPKHQHKAAEEFGYASLLAAFDRRARVEPATFYNRDLVQALTWMRAASDATLEED